MGMNLLKLFFRHHDNNSKLWDSLHIANRQNNHEYGKSGGGNNGLRVRKRQGEGDENSQGKTDKELEAWAECLSELKGMRAKGKGRLKEVDQRMVSMIGGPIGEGLWPFGSAEEYYDWASSYKHLQGVAR